MAEQILIEYKVSVDGLKAELKTVQEQLKATEQVGINSANNTTKAFDATGKSTESLRSQLRKLKEELANATDPKEIERLAKATGKLTDQMQDAGEAARIFSSESKFEQASSALGGITSKLRNLDFKGAADQAKLFGAVAKTITFKETLSSIKDLGSTFANVAKAILANPFVLTLTAIAGIALAIKSYTDSLSENTQVIEENNAAIAKILENTKKLADEYDGLVERRLVADGKFSDLDVKRSQALNKYTELQNKQFAELKEAAKKYREEIGVDDALNIDAKLRKQEELRKRLKELAIVQAKELSQAGRNLNEEIAAINTEGYNIEKKKQDDINKKKLDEINKENDKIKALAKKAAEDLANQKIKDEQGLQKALEDMAAIQERNNDATFADIKAKEEKSWADAVAAADKAGDQINKEVQEDLKKRLQAEKDTQDAINSLQSQSFADTVNAINSLNEIRQNETQSRIDGIEETKDAEILGLDEQLKANEITQKQYDERKAIAEKKAADQEAALKLKAWQAAKNASEIQVLISTAQGIVGALAQTGQLGYAAYILAASVAASGALQLAVIESQPTPKFAKGGEVGGRLHSQGGTMIEAEQGEWVIKRNEAMKNNKLLKAINSGDTDKFIFDNYIAPTLKAQQRKILEGKDSSFAQNIANSMLLNSGFKDSNLLDSLKQSRKNDREIAIFLAKELKGYSHNARNW